MHITKYADEVYYVVDAPRALLYAIMGGFEPVVDEVVDGPCPWHLTRQGFCDCVEPDVNHPVSSEHRARYLKALQEARGYASSATPGGEGG